MSFSNHLENIALDCIFGKIWYSPQELWVGFSRTDPLDTGYGVEEPLWFVDGNNVSWPTGYARVLTHPADWLYAADGVVANLSEITFPTALANWGTVTHFVIWDATWMILYGELSPHKTVSTGQRPRFNIVQLEVFLS